MNALSTLPVALSTRGLAPLSSNIQAASIPFQRWYNFKEAFAPQLVADVVASLPARPITCLDPFGGSGTTALSCQFLGIHPTMIEVNPFLADLAEAKLTAYDIDALTRDHGRLVDFVAFEAQRDLPAGAFPGSPPTFVEPGHQGRWIFDEPIAERIWQYRQFIDGLEARHHARLFRVLLGSVLVPFSNVTISGKGRRYRRNWQERHVDLSQFDAQFDEAFERALYDVCRYHARSCGSYEVQRGDARDLVGSGEAVDLVLTSPPYPNSFDYTDIYNVELWGLGYLQSATDNRALREATVRSHIQIKRPFGHPNAHSPTLARTLDSLASAADRLWDRDIPAMVAAYFADLEALMAGLTTRLRDTGAAVFILGDSRYADVHVDVATIMTELAPCVGFRVVDRCPVRSMRSSPQHGGRFDLTEWLVRLVLA